MTATSLSPPGPVRTVTPGVTFSTLDGVKSFTTNIYYYTNTWTGSRGPVRLQQHEHSLPTLVVVALGTNGPATTAQISQLLEILGPTRLLALVTPHNGNYADVPGLYRALAHKNPQRIDLLDWDARSANHPEWFAPDGIHLGGTAGVDAYAQLVASALQYTGGRPQPSKGAAGNTSTGSRTKRSPRPRRSSPRAPRPPDPLVSAFFAALGGLEALSLDFVSS